MVWLTDGQTHADGVDEHSDHFSGLWFCGQIGRRRNGGRKLRGLRKFHGNRAAYDEAQKLAMIYECAVYGTEQVMIERYIDPSDPRVKGPVDALKAKAHAGMEKRYPKIPDACLDGLLNVWYITISNDSQASQTCVQAIMNKEENRQLGE